MTACPHFQPADGRCALTALIPSPGICQACNNGQHPPALPTPPDPIKAARIRQMLEAAAPGVTCCG